MKTQCSNVITGVLAAWSLVTIFSVLVFGFLDVPSWVALVGNDVPARVIVLIAFYIGGIVATCKSVERCK